MHVLSTVGSFQCRARNGSSQAQGGSQERAALKGLNGLVGATHRHHYSLAIRLFSCNSTKQRRKAIDMTQTTNRFLDEIARLMNDAAGVASGGRPAGGNRGRHQGGRLLRGLAVGKRGRVWGGGGMWRGSRAGDE